ncbi:uncharacterized protein LOC114517004 [Dendronephthya gigantea]|uniref:uncharacterized protein LOC114517004 n=1 Tax=Dendronephthya gigantea TaxID=151771 RepID=UPI001068FDF0|nr:uncharacterized protein LOC114517004 [Dendronephthya gigantea]
MLITNLFSNMAAFRIAVQNVLKSRLISPVLSSKFTPLRRIHTALLLNSERKFTKEHEWIMVENDVGTVGISDHAQNQLGDIVYVELPEVGKTIEKDDVYGVVESVKAASDLYSPASGEIVEVNEDLNENPELVNQEPYDAGWIAKLKLSDISQIDELMDATAYDEFVKETEEE